MQSVSVLIPVYNASILVERCLDSIFEQSFTGTIEAICVDDGSTDDSYSVIESYRKRTGRNIRLLKQPNSGPATARNRALHEATGDYIAYLDADDYWHDSFLEHTTNFLIAHTDCIAVSVGQRHITHSGDHIVPSYLASFHNDTPKVLDDFYAFWAEHNHVCTGSILIRRSAAMSAGGMREDLRICEDLEFWALLASYGKFGFIPEVLFVSDGNKVTNNIGWVNKHIHRWLSAPTIEEWERRLATRFNGNFPKSLMIMRGRIAKNLAMSILYSKRKSLAYDQIKKHADEYPRDVFGRMFRISARCKFAWIIISNALIFREYHK